MYTEVKRNEKIYQRTLDKQIVCLKNVISNSDIEAGDYTMCNEIITAINPKGTTLYFMEIAWIIISKFLSENLFTCFEILV